MAAIWRGFTIPDDDAQVVGNRNIGALMSGHYMYQVYQEHIMIIKPSETLLQILQTITPWCQAIHYLTSQTSSLRRDREIHPRHYGTNAGTWEAQRTGTYRWATGSLDCTSDGQANESKGVDCLDSQTMGERDGTHDPAHLENLLELTKIRAFHESRPMKRLIAKRKSWERQRYGSHMLFPGAEAMAGPHRTR
jgi:hypothetical protein